jgi:hypothetical protein
MTEQPTETAFTYDAPFTATKLAEILADVPLNALDRCDKCGAQAYVHVGVANTELTLMFCGHHFKAVDGDPNLFGIRDECAKLLERPVFASLTDAL